MNKNLNKVDCKDCGAEGEYPLCQDCHEIRMSKIYGQYTTKTQKTIVVPDLP